MIQQFRLTEPAIKDKAEPLLEQSRELAVRKLGANHPTTNLLQETSLLPLFTVERNVG